MENRTIKLTPFLSLNGKAAAALEFYQKHLGARIVFLKTYEDMKEYDPDYKYDADKAKYIAHSVLIVGENQLCISDETINGDRNPNPGNSLSLCLESSSLDTIRSIYASLTADTRVTVIAPLAKNCFSPGYGIIADPFGVIIQLVAE